MSLHVHAPARLRTVPVIAADEHGRAYTRLRVVATCACGASMIAHVNRAIVALSHWRERATRRR